MTSSQKVIVFGASARAWVQSASRASAEVFAVDRFADADTTRIAQTASFREPPVGDREGLTIWIRDILELLGLDHSDEIYSVYGGGLENQADLLECIGKTTRLLGNDANVARRLLDTFSLHSTLKQHGFRVPLSMNREEFESFLKNDSFSPEQRTRDSSKQIFLCKKHRSCGGLGISRIDLNSGNRRQEISALESVPDGEEFYVQEMIPGRLLSASYLAYADSNHSGQASAKLLGITTQLAGDRKFNADEFVYSGSILPPTPTDKQSIYATSIGQRLAADFGLKGLFNIDFIQLGDEFYFLEINPRYSASMELIERRTDDCLFALHREACLDSIRSEPVLQTPESINRVTGKAVWYAKQTRRVPDSFVDDALEQRDPFDRPLIADIPQPGSVIPEGAPVFTVFASGDSTDQVHEKLFEHARMFDSRLLN